MRSSEWYYFQSPRVTLNTVLKVMVLFKGEYLERDKVTIRC